MGARLSKEKKAKQNAFFLSLTSLIFQNVELGISVLASECGIS